MKDQSFPTNRVVIYGYVDEQYRRENKKRKDELVEKKKREPEPDIRSFRNPAGGNDYSVGIQVIGPYGDTYKLILDVGHVEGSELLTTVRPGQGVVVTGSLSRVRTVDRRFSDYEADELIEGIVYRDTQVETMKIRLRTDDDPAGSGSNVAIEGEVVQPPSFFRHPDDPEIELARIVVRTRTQPRVDADGIIVAAMSSETMVVIPVDHDAVGLLYKRGNRVRIRGALDRIALRQANRTLVRDRLNELEESFEDTRAGLFSKELNDKSRNDQLNYEGNRYLRERDRVSRVGHTVVVAVEVSGIPGAGAVAISREEAQADRNQFVTEQRNGWKARQAERQRRRQRNQTHLAAAQDQHANGAGDLGDHESATPVTDEAAATPITESLTHRRKRPGSKDSTLIEVDALTVVEAEQPETVAINA